MWQTASKKSVKAICVFRTYRTHKHTYMYMSCNFARQAARHPDCTLRQCGAFSLDEGQGLTCESIVLRSMQRIRDQTKVTATSRAAKSCAPQHTDACQCNTPRMRLYVHVYVYVRLAC